MYKDDEMRNAGKGIILPLSSKLAESSITLFPLVDS